MLYSFDIISPGGLSLFKHEFTVFESSEVEKNLTSGFLTALTSFTKAAMGDEMKQLFLGSSKFQILRKRDLLFNLHTDLKYPKFLGMLKLAKMVNSFFDYYPEDRDFDFVDASEFDEFHKTVDFIIEERAGETEEIFKIILAGKNITYSILVNRRTEGILFTHSSDPDMGSFFSKKRFLLQQCIREFAPIEEQVAKDDVEYSLLRFGKNWHLSLVYKDLFLFSVYSPATNPDQLHDIIEGVIDAMIIKTLAPFCRV